MSGHCCTPSGGSSRVNQPQARVNNGEGVLTPGAAPAALDMTDTDYIQSVGHTPTTSLQVQVAGLYAISASVAFTGAGEHTAQIYSSVQGVLTSEYAELGENPEFSLGTQARLAVGETIAVRAGHTDESNTVVAHLELVRVSPLT